PPETVRARTEWQKNVSAGELALKAKKYDEAIVELRSALLIGRTGLARFGSLSGIPCRLLAQAYYGMRLGRHSSRTARSASSPEGRRAFLGVRSQHARLLRGSFDPTSAGRRGSVGVLTSDPRFTATRRTPRRNPAQRGRQVTGHVGQATRHAHSGVVRTGRGRLSDSDGLVDACARVCSRGGVVVARLGPSALCLRHGNGRPLESR